MLAVHSVSDDCGNGAACDDAWLAAGVSVADEENGVYCALTARANGVVDDRADGRARAAGAAHLASHCL